MTETANASSPHPSAAQIAELGKGLGHDDIFFAAVKRPGCR